MGSGIHRSDDGPKNGPKLVTFVINCLVHDGNHMDTFNDYPKRGQQITLRHSIKYQKAPTFK